MGIHAGQPDAHRYQSIVDEELDDSEVPHLLVKKAYQSLPKGEPVAVLQLWYDLPRLPETGRGSASFEESLLGGLDVITSLPMESTGSGVLSRLHSESFKICVVDPTPLILRPKGPF